MAPAKRLNLSKSRDDDESSSASSSGDEQERQTTTQITQDDDESSSDEESDDEFEIPPGFESVKGSGSVTREVVFNNDQELWFFKLPKNLDASALANVTFKVDESKGAAPGEVLAKVTAGVDNKNYLLQSEDGMLTDQLVNALPLASDRARFVLGKPFSRCFSLVEDHVDAVPVVKAKKSETVEASPVAEKRKKKHSSDKQEKQHKSKKAKHKK
ncbi:hypothetical protein L917_11854 [Phytophthora nicotianae]|uniref:Succinate dehydrogenase assembly factor 2 n=1 Tax=Phytophthora nicotianae TaxID=4792 RepID=W2KX85_PHYNI|nr:hypothetical protein L915_12087 [Phytophthora nicotianae]ETL89194.1 hypothetical protein L917_11854 [Phytophthora nicotianae]KUF96696.1 Succinate dehydrogenase assembly factor 2 [Phytophthora nicotianae]